MDDRFGVVSQLRLSLDPVELTPLEDASDWQKLQKTNMVQLRRWFEAQLVWGGVPKRVAAHCGICASTREVELTTRHAELTPNGGLRIAYSETGECIGCKCNSRIRFACDVALLGRGLGEPFYLCEQKTNLFRCLSHAGYNVTGSEYLGRDKVGGRSYDGIQHQDVHQLSFPSESFSVVLCLDVLEHVNDPVTAVVELHRILKSGGLAVLTFPFFDRPESVVRSRVSPDGSVVNVLPAQFHGNPLGGGALVFRELGWDFIHEIQRCLGRD